mmetsp:Transcript_109630/g.189688  ORF Transcript_109630/g.189688 Transcript_109630/m.189688 type:complete len:166 (-) Transcript_109630:68-565(-)
MMQSMLLTFLILAGVPPCTMGAADTSCPHGQCDSQGSGIEDDVTMMQVDLQNKHRKPVQKGSKPASMSQAAKDDDKESILSFKNKKFWSKMLTKLGVNSISEIRSKLNAKVMLRGEKAVLKELKLPTNISFKDLSKALGDYMHSRGHSRESLLEKIAVKGKHTSG